MKQSPTEEQSRAHGELVQEAKRFQRYAGPRRQMEVLWALICAQPMKFPAPSRRRRSDREIPKAA